MYILAFDTSLDKTYILIKNNEEIKTAELLSDEKAYHSAYLISKIKEMGFCPEKLDYIITNSGPGSFTGIRAGLSVAKVMAMELNIPVIPLNTCEILKDASNLENCAVLLDARRNMYYFSKGDEIELILKDEVLDKVKEYKNLIVDKGVVRDFSGILENNLVDFETKNYELEKTLLKLGEEKYNASKNPKEEFCAANLKANYIQTPPVFQKN